LEGTHATWPTYIYKTLFSISKPYTATANVKVLYIKKNLTQVGLIYLMRPTSLELLT